MEAAHPLPVLIVGGTGGVGRHVVRMMSERNVPIRLLVRNPERAREVLRPFITNPNIVEFVQGDLTRPETLNEPVKNVSGVINVSGPTDTFFGTNTVKNVDYRGMQNLIAALKRTDHSRVRTFVFLSSSGVQNAWRSIALNISLGNYAKWKLAAEKELKKSGIPYCIVRPGSLGNHAGTRNVTLSQGDTVGWPSTSREDVAWVCVEAMLRDVRGVTFELGGGEKGATAGEDSLAKQFSSLKPDS